MVSLLHPCSYLAAIIAFLFVTLSLGGCYFSRVQSCWRELLRARKRVACMHVHVYAHIDVADSPSLFVV